MGTCNNRTKYFGMVTVTDKGQIAIPIELRKFYDIKKGDKLIITQRKDKKGFNLLKSDLLKEFLDKISQN